MNFYDKNKKYIWIGVLLIGVIIVLKAIKKRVNPLLTRNKPLVVSNNGRVGNDGGLQLSNSLSNIETLLKNKIDIIEINVQLSSDNIPVLFRDTKLDSLTNGFGFVKNKTAMQLKSLSYKSYPNEKIALLSDALVLLKKYNPNSIFYVSNLNDINYYEEITLLNELNFFKGYENNFLIKGVTAEKPVAVYNAGLLYMNTVPYSFVGTLNNSSSISQLVNRCKESNFVRLQFNDKDSFVTNGQLASQLSNVGCNIWFDALDQKLAIPQNFKGDSIKEWDAILKMTNSKAIVTNSPLILKSKLGN